MPKPFLQPDKPRHLQNHLLPPVQSLPLRSLFSENALVIWKFIVGGLVFIPFWLVFGICILIGNSIGSIRSVFASVRIPQAESADLLSALDSLWLAQPGTKHPHSIANVVMKLGNSRNNITMKDFVDILTTRLLNVKNPRSPPPFFYNRFRQRLYTIPGTSRSVFAFSPRFDIANHIHQIPQDVDTTEKFMTFVGTIMQNPFEQEKPLWDMHIRTDFGPEKCGILLFRFHQCITDGQSMIQALCRDILDGGDQIYPQLKPRFGGMTYAGHFCKAVFMSGYIFLTDLMSPGPSDLNILKHPETKLTGKYDIFWSEPVNLSVIQRLKSITRCHFNDILFTALAATLRTYCKMHGVSTPADMTACFPVDLRSGRGEGINDLQLGNQFVMEKIHLPVSQEGGMPQLWRVRDQTQQLRRGYRHVALDFLLKILKKALSQRFITLIWNRYFGGCTLLINSLAGPEGILTIQDFTMDELMMWIPPPHGMGLPLTINIMTSLHEVHLVIVADTGAVADAFWIAMTFPHEVMALGNLLKTRRVPETGTHLPKQEEEGETAVEASLKVLEERLVKIQMALCKMRRRREDVGQVPALWKELNILLPSEKASVSSSQSDDEESHDSTESESEPDDSEEEDSGGSGETDEGDGDSDDVSDDVSGEGETGSEAGTASGDATSMNSKVVKVKVKPVENSEDSVNESPLVVMRNSKSIRAPSPPSPPSAPSAPSPTVEEIDETQNFPDRRASVSPGKTFERRLSAKPTLFSALTTPTLVGTVGTVVGVRAVPGQLSQRRMSQAVRTIPTIVPAANRRISRS